MSYTGDEAHCLGFLDTLVGDLLPLTAESRGQLGLTRTNLQGHLETPRCTALGLSHTLLHTMLHTY